MRGEESSDRGVSPPPTTIGQPNIVPGPEGAHKGSANSLGGPGANLVPNWVKLYNTDGEFRRNVKLQPDAPGWLEVSLVKPCRGWFGSGGFLRKASYFFWSVFGGGTVGLSFALHSADFLGACSTAFLMMGSACAAIAAWSHDAVARQLAAGAEWNGTYASMLHDKTQRLADLIHMKQEAERLAAERAKAEEEWAKAAGAIDMERMTCLVKIDTLIRAFTDAEMNLFFFEKQTPDHRLSCAQEIEPFIRDVKHTLTTCIKDIDLNDLSQKFSGSFADLLDLAILAAAACVGTDKERKCMMALLYFLLEPANRELRSGAAASVEEHLEGAPRFGSAEAVREEVERLAKTVERQRVPTEQSRPLVTAVLSRRLRPPTAEPKAKEKE